jgi:hypothetical protein
MSTDYAQDGYARNFDTGQESKHSALRDMQW